MAVNPKTLVAVATLGGGCVSIPLILWQTNNLGFSSSQPEIRTIVQRLPEVIKLSVANGNCEVEELTKEHKDFLSAQKQGGFYVEILCENTKTDTRGGSLTPAWTGLFPAQLLTNGEKLSIRERFNLETSDSSNDTSIRTTFKGGKIKETVTGTWGEESSTKDGHKLVSVSFPDRPDIKNNLYLILYT